MNLYHSVFWLSFLAGKLSKEGVAVRSPSMSPDGSKLVWLEREAGGPHHSCHRLMIYDWKTQEVFVICYLIVVVPNKYTDVASSLSLCVLAKVG